MLIMLSLINLNNNIDATDQLNCAKTWKLANVSNFNKTIDHSRTTADYETNLLSASQSLNRINKRVSNSPSTRSALSQIFKNILKNKFQTTLSLTKNCYKIYSLRRSLPKLIAAVNHEVMFIFASIDYKTLENEKIDASSSPDSQLKHRKIEALHELHADMVASKWQVVNKVKELFHQQYPDQATWDETAQEVDNYIQNKWNTLSQGEDVALPCFYHATQETNWEKIFSSKKILPMPAPWGHGAYVSTNDEACDRFGFKTFALDDSALYIHKAHYFRGRLSSNHNNSLWIRVDHEIEISAKTVAHFVVPGTYAGHDVHAKFVTTSLGISTITRKSSDRINALFNQAIVKRHLPKTWKHRLGGSVLFGRTPNTVSPSP
jgi:hypothetical protein